MTPLTTIELVPKTAALKDNPPLVGTSVMPVCRMCKQNYPQAQFITGNGPRYQVCSRCGVEHGLADPENTPQFYSDEILNARLSLYTKRHLPWVSVLIGWFLFLSIGRGIELWSGLFFGVLALSSLIVPVLHFMGSTRFIAELSRITP
ncbi:MAG TPA: hypothetical protein EYQ11_03480 [Candidatus Poseidoniales archaeon]|jgi:hypothetical protein|nr:MAG: hypothetical protein CXT66_02870 [Euryarchaeota archaeon]HIG33928.1 hypothetical protein [Candidatus Poseidoniales archaeon]HIL67592.1 hypothetical protein [Candidatus Poseidoniales archaeon]